MSELPAPDIRDSGGRLRRLALTFAIAGVLAAAVYVACTALATPDTQGNGVAVRGAYRFVWYFTGGTFFGVFGVVLAFLNRREKHKWMAAQAKVVE